MDSDTKLINALIIEDSEDDALLLLNTLKRANFIPAFHRVDTPEQLGKSLEKEWDIIFCDYSMPRMTGTQALKIVRAVNHEVPFIFVSGTIGEDVAVEAMRNGAQDYIVKGSLARLPPAVERELKESANKKKHSEMKRRLHFLSHRDGLTGLPNRTELVTTVSSAVTQVEGQNQMLALILINVDRFKTVNEVLGYEAGNLLLKAIAERLDNLVLAPHMLARLTADEFSILLRGIETKDGVAGQVEAIRKAFEAPFLVHDWNLYFTASIGISIFPEDAGCTEEMLRNADLAIHRVKREGGNYSRFYSAELAVRLEDRLSLDHAMRQGLSNKEFVLHYQPQVDLNTGLMAGVEALIRWQRGDQSLVAPDRFIPLAEETGFIEMLGAWVLEEACAQARCWIDAGCSPLRMAVNLSARQFYDPKLPNLISSLLQRFRLEPSTLELEITESAIIHDLSRASAMLSALKEIGVKVALDDFGTGYSSLSQLKTFRVDFLKIDRSFIFDIPGNPDSTTISAALIAMVSKLGIKVVAEGVETEEQLKFLRDEGCDYVQGYYLGRPVPASELSDSLRE